MFAGILRFALNDIEVRHPEARKSFYEELPKDPPEHVNILLGWKPQPTICKTVELWIATLNTLHTIQSFTMTISLILQTQIF